MALCSGRACCVKPAAGCKPGPHTLATLCREAEILAEERQNVVLEAIGDCAGVRAGINLEAVCDSVAIEDVVELGGIESQAILIAHIHCNGTVLLEIPDVLMVVADQVQIQQVLMNLMLNGIEAMKETGGILTVKTEPGEGGQVLISVSDTGVGLPAGRADEIFDAFFTTKPQGTGMGLAISRPIVESHGGRDVSFHPANRSREFLLQMTAWPCGYMIYLDHPNCSAVMYSAYQSGQFASLCPLRFSCSQAPLS
jgi:signal transduction histidine kinase